MLVTLSSVFLISRSSGHTFLKYHHIALTLPAALRPMKILEKNFKPLHIIRGVAALLVVIYHSKFILWAGGALWLKNIGLKNFSDYLLFAIDLLSSCGQQCVLVFFILSGFVIYYSFKKSDQILKHFFVVRILRIYIPFLFSLLLSILVLFLVVKFTVGLAVNDVREYNTRLLSAYNETGVLSILKTIFFIPGKEYAGFNFAYWSLLHEAIFYIVFPIYFFMGIQRRVFTFIILLIGYLLTKNNILYFQLYFLCGMFLYDYYCKNPGLIFKNSRLYFPLIIICFCSTNVLVKLSLSFCADLTALCTIILCFDYLLIKDITYNRFLKALANMSFTLYLNHLWVLMIWYAICFKYSDTHIIYQRYPYYFGILISLIVCWFLYKLIEERSLVLINNLKSKWNKSISRVP